MKLSARELHELEQLVVAWEQKAGFRGTAGVRARPLSLAELIVQRRRALERRVG